MTAVAVDLGTHADALDLMRMLDRFHPWTVKLAREHWVVLVRSDERERVDAALALVSQWANEHGVPPLACRTGEDELVLRSVAAVARQ